MKKNGRGSTQVVVNMKKQVQPTVHKGPVAINQTKTKPKDGKSSFLEYKVPSRLNFDNIASELVTNAASPTPNNLALSP